MKAQWVGVVTLGLVVVSVLVAAAPPPEEKDGRPERKGPPPGPPPGRFELGRVLPLPMRDALELTDEQELQLEELEHLVRERLLKLLTAEQRKKVRELSRRPPPPPPGRRPVDGPPDKRGPASW